MQDVEARLRTALGGRYRIEGEIGRGGMAIVFLAYDVKHKRQVALKVLRPEISAVVGAERFHREIEIAARLQHPHILPLHDSGEADGLLYYVMPFVVGESLRDLLKRKGRLHWKEAVSIASEVASALNYAHSEDVIHRDIKPGNILISQGHAVVADFGIAMAVSGSQNDEQGAPLEFAIGTPAYMSPEQALSEPDVDGRSDVYSLGCVMFEMLCGVPPADEQTTRSFLLKDTEHTVPKFDGTVRWQIPRGIRGATAAALAQDRRERYQSAAELRTALIQAMRAGGSPFRWATQLVGSAVILLGLVYFLSLELGLPAWVFQALAIVSGIQIGMLIYATRIERSGQRLKRLSRRRIQTAGALAVVGVGLLSALYMTGTAFSGSAEATAPSRVSNQPLIMLVDFVNRTSDSLLGIAATDAFRVDLAQSKLLSAVRSPTVGVYAGNGGVEGLENVLAVARDRGVMAVLVGEVTTVGDEFLLTARLVSPADRSTMAAERVTAHSANDVIAAIDTLSTRMREHALELRTNFP